MTYTPAETCAEAAAGEARMAAANKIRQTVLKSLIKNILSPNAPEING